MRNKTPERRKNAMFISVKINYSPGVTSRFPAVVSEAKP